MHRLRLTLSLAFVWLAACGAALAAITHAEERTNSVSRHFGLLIGDPFTQQLRIAVPAAYWLERSSLPKVGRANRWLDLRATNIAESATGSERIYAVTLHYQVITSDEMLSLATLPRPMLRFVSGNGASGSDNAANTLTLRLGERLVSISPISGIDAAEAEGLQALRPERGTPLANTIATQRRIAAYLITLGLLAAYWAYRIYGVPFLARSRGPFARAWRVLRRQRSDDAAAAQSALRELHRAFDKAFGATMYTHGVDTFLTRHPRYAELREPIQRFFALSRGRFYANTTLRHEQALAELRALARRLSLLERGLT